MALRDPLKLELSGPESAAPRGNRPHLSGPPPDARRGPNPPTRAEDPNPGAFGPVEAPNHPTKAEFGTRTLTLTKTAFIDREDFREADSKDFYGLAPGKTVRLRYARCVTCTAVVKDASGNVTSLKCEVVEPKEDPKGMHRRGSPLPGNSFVQVSSTGCRTRTPRRASCGTTTTSSKSVKWRTTGRSSSTTLR